MRITKIVLFFLLYNSAFLYGQYNLSNIQEIIDSAYVDKEEWRELPVKHHYIHGGFKGTDTKFSFYYPPKEKYQGRFFQYITPVPDNENLSQGAQGEGDKIGFSVASGAYFVETNGGGTKALVGDPTIGAYRANAACAIYSKEIAKRIYGAHRVFGYAFGGSGGAYRTIGCIENTEGVWDGAVPFVIGSPMAIPNVFTVRMHAMRVLQSKLPQIADAIEPGGDEDFFNTLNEEEKSAFIEVTKMGFPLKAWFNYKNMGIHAFPAIYGGMMMADKNYFEDFWKVSGYLGANPPESLLAARVQHSGKIVKSVTQKEAIPLGISQGDLTGEAHGSADSAWKNLGKSAGSLPVAFILDNMLPTTQFLGGELIVKTGNASGKKLNLSGISGDKVILGTNDLSVIALISPGDEVEVNNLNFLAAQTYHRHQVPGKEYPVWNQFRDQKQMPIYPQRPMLLGPLFTKFSTGSLPSGIFKGKMIVLESLWDSEAFPWQADWYRNKVRENLGDKFDDNFRLWYTDHANHADFENPGDPTHLVSYLGVLQQALRDISLWAEKGIAPPLSTAYRIVDGQVEVPEKAEERRGIQPVVSLKINNNERVVVAVGNKVTYSLVAELPANTGKITKVEWDFEGTGSFLSESKLKKTESKDSSLILRTSHVFSKPGTYFSVVRISSQRNGNSKTAFAVIKNLARVRVVVK